MHIAGARIGACCDSRVGHKIKFVANNERGRTQRRAFFDRPINVRRSGIAFCAFGANRDQIRNIEARRDEKQPVRKHRARHQRVAFSVGNTPNFVPVLRIVSADNSAARENNLRGSAERNGQRRAKGERLFRSRVARRFPAHISSSGVERDDEWLLRPIATKDERITNQRRRTAVAMHRRILQPVLLPHDFAREIQRRSSHVAEVNVEPVIRHDGRGAGERVFAMDGARRRSVGIKNHRIPKRAPVLRIETHRVQSHIALSRLTHGGSEIQPPLRQHWRRPSLPREFHFPSYALRRAPLLRHVRRSGNPLPSRSAKLRPFRFRCIGSGGRENDGEECCACSHTQRASRARGGMEEI